VSLCCAKAGARPAANEKAAAPATKVLRVWLIVLSCHSRKISVRRPDSPPRHSAPPSRCSDSRCSGLRRPGCSHPSAQPRPKARPLRRLSWADDIWKVAVFIWKQHYRQFATCKGNQPGAWRPNVPVRLKSLTEEPRIVASTRFNRPTKDMLDPSLRPQPRSHRVRCCAEGELLLRICCRPHAMRADFGFGRASFSIAPATRPNERLRVHP
jgi:hypothetical protein